MKKLPLLNRINRVINTFAFDDALRQSGDELFDFQLNLMTTWKGASFAELPEKYRKPILAGEKELRYLSRCSSFRLNDVETTSLNIWSANHQKSCGRLRESTYTTMFTGTAIGMKSEVKCNKCGKVKDITDYESW